MLIAEMPGFDMLVHGARVFPGDGPELVTDAAVAGARIATSWICDQEPTVGLRERSESMKHEVIGVRSGLKKAVHPVERTLGVRGRR